MSVQAVVCDSSDSLSLPGKYWKAADQVAVVMVLHGLGEHIGRYARFARAANKRGISVVGADLRGHGAAPGDSCVVNSFDDYAADAQAIATVARQLAAGQPLFLLGHSMGGAVALRFLTRYPEWRRVFAGLVLSSAALRIGRNVSPLVVRLAPLIAFVAPGLRLQPIDPALISRDPEVVADYIADPLVAHRPPPARTANALLMAMEANRAAVPGLRLPLYVLHGDADRLTDPEGSRELFAAWPARDKTLRIWPGSYHEALHDLDARAVTSELLDWVTAHAN